MIVKYLFPGQVLDIDELTGPIRQLYLMTKIWKARFPAANFKSYTVKKLLLDPARRHSAQTDRKAAWEELMAVLQEYASKGMSEEEGEYARNIQMFLEQCK